MTEYREFLGQVTVAILVSGKAPVWMSQEEIEKALYAVTIDTARSSDPEILIEESSFHDSWRDIYFVAPQGGDN